MQIDPKKYRERIWEMIMQKYDEEPIILIGDLNTIEVADNRFMNLGKILLGPKKSAWVKCKKQFNLLDSGVMGQFTRQNYGSRDLLRKD